MGNVRHLCLAVQQSLPTYHAHPPPMLALEARQLSLRVKPSSRSPASTSSRCAAAGTRQRDRGCGALQRMPGCCALRIPPRSEHAAFLMASRRPAAGLQAHSLDTATALQAKSEGAVRRTTAMEPLAPTDAKNSCMG